MTISSLKFPVASALFRPSKSCHVTMCLHSSAYQKISLYSTHIRHRRETGKMFCQRQWERRRAQTHVIYSTSAIILALAGRMSAVLGNTVPKTAHASSWEAASSQESTGENFWRPRRRMVLLKEASVPLPNTASHRRVKSANSEPTAGDRSGNRNTFMTPPNP